MSHFSRRNFLKRAGMGTAAAALLANGGLPASLTRKLGMPSIASASVAAQTGVQLIVGDVVGFSLGRQGWEGDFGSVTFQLHQALYNGESAYYIRTDASNPDYAAENRLVFVPLMTAATSVEGATAILYTFANGAGEQLPVMSTVPGNDDYSPAWHVHTVTFNGEPTLLDSAAAVEEAAANGDVTIEAQPLVVNHPVVKWPGGELQEDPAALEALGGGPLLAPVDTDTMRATFKLHECYEQSRYIITDTSAVPMAPMMAVAPSGPSQGLRTAGAVDEVWIFVNGLPGPGVMGFQPAIFDNTAGNPIWSPYWEHFAVAWNNEADAVVVSSSAQLRELEAAGAVTIYKGVPDMDQSMDPFVVNCPVPIIAPTTYNPA
ncbi:MAG: twin-arginine translocation signal domain-containing protein [Chloroflexota bacterium]